ncbi:MAG TPA: hypothetical protein VF544_18300 [Pyrinomonadaceae bacterium]|jgi:predicted transcriptional regulator
MSKEYIEQRDGGYYIIGKRISLDSVVYALREAYPEWYEKLDRVRKEALSPRQ